MKPRELVETLWSRAHREAPAPPDPVPRLSASRLDLIDNPELSFVNQNYSLEVPTEAPRDPAAGRLQRSIEAAVTRSMDAVLRRYFAREQEFLGHLVRFQNQVARHVDEIARHADGLAERVDLLSDAVGECREIAQRAEALHAVLEQRLAAGGQAAGADPP